MDNGKIATSINESVKLLSEFKLLKDSRIGNINTFSKQYMEVSRSGDYLKVYDVVTMNSDYTILLTDDSFFQFHVKDDNGGYIFMQNPRIHPDRESFIYELYGSEEIPENDIDQFNDLYEQYLNEQSLNSSAIYMRMDFEERTYMNFIHSLAHLHININSEIRIPLDKILSPLAFCCFVLKHVYYKRWKEEVGKKYFANYKKRLRESICNHPDMYWTDEDQLNLYIS